MTEAEWLAFEDAQRMLGLVRGDERPPGTYEPPLRHLRLLSALAPH